MTSDFLSLSKRRGKHCARLVAICSFSRSCLTMRTQGEIHEDKLAGMIRDSTLPFDGCTGVIKRLPHTATLGFEKPGEALIQI